MSQPHVNGRKRPGIKAEDIRHEGRLTDEQIAEIPIEHVYEWVRVGNWKKKHFEKWLRVLRVIE